MVLTSKHHDGFAMFKSDASAYNVVDATPFKRDVVKELAEACPKHGVRFGTYYSFLADWGHKGGGSGGPHWDPALQGGDLHAYVHDVAMPQVKELLTHYGPLSVMWFDTDGSQGITPAESDAVVQLLQTQPQMIVNPRLAGVKGDYGSAEIDVPFLTPKGDWELCGTINPSWGYTPAPPKPLNVLLPYIITAWARAGMCYSTSAPRPKASSPQARWSACTRSVNGFTPTGTPSTAAPPALRLSSLGHRDPKREYSLLADFSMAG